MNENLFKRQNNPKEQKTSVSNDIHTRMQKRGRTRGQEILSELNEQK